MFLVYVQNNTGSTYHMLNIGSKLIVLSRDVICLDKTYGQYVSRKENTTADSYVLQDEEDSNNWSHVKIDPVKNEIKSENVKNEGKVKTQQYSSGEKDAQKTIKSVSF